MVSISQVGEKKASISIDFSGASAPRRGLFILAALASYGPTPSATKEIFGAELKKVSGEREGLSIG